MRKVQPVELGQLHQEHREVVPCRLQLLVARLDPFEFGRQPRRGRFGQRSRPVAKITAPREIGPVRPGSASIGPTLGARVSVWKRSVHAVRSNSLSTITRASTSLVTTAGMCIGDLRSFAARTSRLVRSRCTSSR